MFGWLFGRFVVWLVGRSVGCSVGWLVGWSVAWLVGWFFDRLVGWLVDWLFGRLVCWAIAWLVCLEGWWHPVTSLYRVLVAEWQGGLGDFSLMALLLYFMIAFNCIFFASYMLSLWLTIMDSGYPTLVTLLLYQIFFFVLLSTIVGGLCAIVYVGNLFMSILGHMSLGLV